MVKINSVMLCNCFRLHFTCPIWAHVESVPKNSSILMFAPVSEKELFLPIDASSHSMRHVHALATMWVDFCCCYLENEHLQMKSIFSKCLFRFHVTSPRVVNIYHMKVDSNFHFSWKIGNCKNKLSLIECNKKNEESSYAVQE